MSQTSRTEPDRFAPPANSAGNFYRHVDGGCYQVIARGKETETGIEMVAYVHRYPFEIMFSFRTAENFDGMTDGRKRFTPITQTEAENLMATDRAQVQAAVNTARATRRASRPSAS